MAFSKAKLKKLELDLKKEQGGLVLLRGNENEPIEYKGNIFPNLQELISQNRASLAGRRIVLLEDYELKSGIVPI